MEQSWRVSVGVSGSVTGSSSVRLIEFVGHGWATRWPMVRPRCGADHNSIADRPLQSPGDGLAGGPGPRPREPAGLGVGDGDRRPALVSSVMASTLSGSAVAGGRVPIPPRPPFGLPNPVEVFGAVAAELRPPRWSHGPAHSHVGEFRPRLSAHRCARSTVTPTSRRKRSGRTLNKTGRSPRRRDAAPDRQKGAHRASPTLVGGDHFGPLSLPITDRGGVSPPGHHPSSLVDIAGGF